MSYRVIFSVMALALMLTATQSFADKAVHRSDLAQAGGGQVQIIVETTCANGYTLFKIQNAGDAWPRPGTLNVVRVNNGALETITQRQMRFAAGQKASFRLKNPDNDTLGVYVDPSWYERTPQLDARVSCN